MGAVSVHYGIFKQPYIRIFDMRMSIVMSYLSNKDISGEITSKHNFRSIPHVLMQSDNVRDDI